MAATPTPPDFVTVDGMTMAYGSFVVQSDVSFSIRRGSVFVVMGDSGSGKSTLMRHMIGLDRPSKGDVRYSGTPYWSSTELEQRKLRRRFGVLFQGAGLLSSMTLAENISLSLKQHLKVEPGEAREVAVTKLELVGLGGFEDSYPSQVSGGMRNRAGLARALSLDPDILFLDEPSAGLDPLSARHLDDLILELRDSLGTTFFVVTHELPSIFAIADDAIFLDGERHRMVARGAPREMAATTTDPKVKAFLERGQYP
ncbi:MAG: ATP-binding cassette domain-containing protein [Deltaproteobacteria bacterium]